MRFFIAAAAAFVVNINAISAWAQTPPAGMATYQVAFLKRGAPDSSETRVAHLAYSKQLYDDGLLVAAGPILAEGELRTVVVLKAPGLDRAQSLARPEIPALGGRIENIGGGIPQIITAAYREIWGR